VIDATGRRRSPSRSICNRQEPHAPGRMLLLLSNKGFAQGYTETATRAGRRPSGVVIDDFDGIVRILLNTTEVQGKPGP